MRLIKATFFLFVILSFLSAVCCDNEEKDYPDIAGTWSILINTTTTNCLFDEDLTDELIGKIVQNGGTGTITLYDAADTALSAPLITYNFTLTTGGSITIHETANYNVWEDGFPEGTTSAMNATGTASPTSISLTYSETVSVPLQNQPIPVYVCVRGGSITGTKTGS